MNPKQTVPLLAAIPALAAAPPLLIAVAPPLLIGAALGLGLIWLFSDDATETKPETPKPMSEAPKPTPAQIAKPALVPPAPVPVLTVSPAPVAPAPAVLIQAKADAPIQFKHRTITTKKRITREDLAEALEYGARTLSLSEAVIALQARGFGKTAAYKALSVQSKFGDLIENTPDGLVEWKG